MEEDIPSDFPGFYHGPYCMHTLFKYILVRYDVHCREMVVLGSKLMYSFLSVLRNEAVCFVCGLAFIFFFPMSLLLIPYILTC